MQDQSSQHEAYPYWTNLNLHLEKISPPSCLQVALYLARFQKCYCQLICKVHFSWGFCIIKAFLAKLFTKATIQKENSYCLLLPDLCFKFETSLNYSRLLSSPSKKQGLGGPIQYPALKENYFLCIWFHQQHIFYPFQLHFHNLINCFLLALFFFFHFWLDPQFIPTCKNTDWFNLRIAIHTNIFVLTSLSFK